jgi:hypothetical protein
VEAVAVLGLGTLKANILGNRFVGHIAAARDEVAAPPHGPTQERRPQPSIILEEVMGAFPLNRLHYTARREVGRGAQQQMDMVGTDMPVTERSNAATEERLKSGHAVGGESIV